ncbi:Fic family protein [Pontibacter sp. E15-1]|uniref:Fic family protein n=1 Tax=Pontibacter sp. E15-1 TaxID=2919918 RepID=UPI001F4FEFD9|nr:Fic/DOC family N-terminal domain-containing protein [Pontibacter sp. E15-1]MCJ8167592.1 Fic family protein [Pontibacter sp. E15-1]
MAPFHREEPYNGLPLLPPDADLETKEVMRKAIKASRAQVQLNGAIMNLPNPSLFLDTIHLQEAKASSEIENIITTNDDLYKSVVAEKRYESTAAKEVICYKEALWYGLEKLKQRPFITTNLCVEIMQCIKQNTSGIRATPGTTLSNTQGKVIYTPPTGEAVIREKLANLERFINEEGALDPLIKMAVMHYQFEAIHPFIDGNGRTGRILLLLYLKMEKLLDVPALFLSEYIIQHKAAYYQKIRAVTEAGDWEGWILYMLDMIEKTAINGLEKLEEIMAVMEATSDEIKERLPKVYSKELVEILFRLPYTKRQFLIDAHMGTPKTVGNYLIALENEGFLKATKVGKEKLYLNHRLMDVLDNKVKTRARNTYSA